MSENKEFTVNREGWGPGPWDDEPDRFEWRFLGMPCLIVRSSFGGLCGYVGVPRERVASIDVDNLDVHGGITFSGGCQEDGPICHVPLEGETDDITWLGFDCGHAWDYTPGLHAKLRRAHDMAAKFGISVEGPKPIPWDETYRTFSYVKQQVEKLAAQVCV